MEKKFTSILFFIGLFLFSVHVRAQYRNLDSYSINFSYGFLKSDFGARYDWNTSINNNAFELGGKLYFNPFPYSDKWGSHFKSFVGLELVNGKLEHIGRWSAKNTPYAQKLKAMHGRPLLVGFGVGLEYSLQDLRYYNFSESYGIYKFNPYIGITLQGYYYRPYVYSDLGDINDPGVQGSIIVPRFVNHIYNDGGFVFAPSFNVGVSYQLNYYMQIYWENRFTWFASDKIDGLDVNDNADKFNDWLVLPVIGLYVVLQ